jgi:predicted short-subunit dehydrogenase-like oxidoreductase (DUF2520 family)
VTLNTINPYWIVGPGRIGLSLGSVIESAGLASEILFIGRDAAPPNHAVMQSPRVRYTDRLSDPPSAGASILLSVPDGSIEDVAREIAGLGTPGPGCTALHLSGSQPASVLAPLADRGYAIGSLHPLQTVAEPGQGAERLRGAFFAFEGDERARDKASRVVAAADGQMLEVHASDKARYHAACVFASNYVVTCAAVATQLLAEAADIGEEEAARALQPLWHGAIANLDSLGPPRALTGPVARGDLGTVKAHLATLDGRTRELYTELALQALELSVKAGLDEGVAERIEKEIRQLRIEGGERR